MTELPERHDQTLPAKVSRSAPLLAWLAFPLRGATAVPPLPRHVNIDPILYSLVFCREAGPHQEIQNLSPYFLRFRNQGDFSATAERAPAESEACAVASLSVSPPPATAWDRAR